MIKTRLPSALVYGLNRFGSFQVKSDIYFEEGLFEWSQVYSYEDPSRFNEHFSNHDPDVIITVGDEATKSLKKFFDENVSPENLYIKTKWLVSNDDPAENVLANDIVCQSTFWSCSANLKVYSNKDLPFFSAFTGMYKTGKDRIERAYQSLRNQTYPNWEWVVIDDSPEDHTESWEVIQEICKKDYRVKAYKIQPVSGGNVGEVKHRAASLCNGTWLLELDHDDSVISTLFEKCVDAIKQFPDGGFIYTDVCELFEDGEMRPYGMIADNREWYGHPDNWFDWAYAGHEWVEADGNNYLSHCYPEINPKTIRFNIGMPNHARLWRKDIYNKVGGHNRLMPVADDYELIVKTFLETPMIHIREMLYLQYNNRNSTVNNNGTEINRRARLIRDHYDKRIHQKILSMDKIDGCWNEEQNHSYKLQNDRNGVWYGEKEQILNYIYDEKTK